MKINDYIIQNGKRKIKHQLRLTQQLPVQSIRKRYIKLYQNVIAKSICDIEHVSTSATVG